MTAPKGAVAAGHAVTADAAAEILGDGGNVFDAAIAGLWAACVAEPVLASPGGGGFLMAHRSGGPGELFDFFVAAPKLKRPGTEFRAATVDFGTATQVFHIGAGAAAVPGFVPGLFEIHAALGSLPMPRLLEPAIRAARRGVALTPFQAHVARLVAPILFAEPASEDHFAPGGALPAAGTVLVNTDLAATFEALGREGARLFASGEIAQAMARHAADGRGHLTLGDLAAYEVVRRPPLRIPCGRWTLALNPPPAAGGALVGLALRLAARETGNSLARALACAQAQVDRLRGSASDLPAGDIVDKHLAGLVRDATVRPTALRGTTHISVVDTQGNAAAATVSNGEGNGHLVAGFLMNNVLGEDDVNPGGFGTWTPGERPASMMAPMVMTGDVEAIALGSGGSSRIRSAMTLVAARLAAGTSLADAVTGPRLHVEGGHLDFEDDFAPDERRGLVEAFPDHRAWPEPSLYFGGVHVASVRRGAVDACADPRRGGVVRFA